jgi:hypothetical protein
MFRPMACASYTSHGLPSHVFSRRHLSKAGTQSSVAKPIFERLGIAFHTAIVHNATCGWRVAIRKPSSLTCADCCISITVVAFL